MPLPNLIIAGVHRAGTTSLFRYLGDHPEILPSHTKELQFWSQVRGEPDLKAYSRNWSHSKGERYRLEASPMYLHYTIAELIKRYLPDVRIIVILREPVERLTSLYNRAIATSELPPSMSFNEFVRKSEEWQPGIEASSVFVRGLRDGFYVDDLPRWDAVFEDNLKILFFDQLKRDTGAVMLELFEWIGLEPIRQEFPKQNITLDYRSRLLHGLAHKAYMKMEPFWRRHYGVKSIVKSAYDLLNGAKLPNQALDRTRAQEIYEPYNRQLREFLLSKGHEELPGWLA